MCVAAFSYAAVPENYMSLFQAPWNSCFRFHVPWNTHGISCGTWKLWAFFMHHEIVASVFHVPWNSLLYFMPGHGAMKYIFISFMCPFCFMKSQYCFQNIPWNTDISWIPLKRGQFSWDLVCSDGWALKGLLFVGTHLKAAATIRRLWYTLYLAAGSSYSYRDTYMK